MKKFYFLIVTILTVASVQANVITGNFSICLPGPNTTQLSASALPAPITATTPWFSLNPAVATISSSGLVTAVSFGATTITYTDNLGFQYSENVYVSAFPIITASNGTSTCASGGNLQLEGSLFPNVNTPWESLNPTIATIDNTGFITGVAAGVATILYRNLGGCTTTIPITINSLLLPTIVCGVSTPTSRTFNWNAVPTAQTYVIFYSINGGPNMSGGTGPALTYTLNGIIQTDNVTLFVIPSGPIGSCFQLGSLTCAGTPCPEAGTGSQITICDSNTTSINLSSMISGEDLGGTWTRTSGTGGTFNALAGTFTPATGATTSTFTYTLTAIAPCLNDSSVATVNINSQPNAGLDGATTICNSSSTVINLFSLITGEQVGGTWTRTSGTGGTFNALVGTFTPATVATSSTFTYSLIGTAPCLNDTSIATININSQPNAGVDGSTTICDNNVSTIDLIFLIAGEQVGGTWTRMTGFGGIFNALTGTYTPSTGATSSSFSYSFIGTAPCINDSSTATVNINSQPTVAILSGNQSVCLGLTTTFSATVNGGTWSSSNPAIATVDSVTGVITGVATGVATISYTITATLPCVNGVYTRSVTVSATVQPTIDGFQGVCVGSNTVFSATPSGGTWSSSNSTVATVDATGYILGIASGTTTITYTVLAAGGCVATSTSRSVTVSTTPTLQLSSSPSTAFQSVCINSPISSIEYSVDNVVAADIATVGLPSGVSGSLNSGTFSITGTPLGSGTFQYTVIAAGPCGGVSISGTIVVLLNSSLFLISDPFTSNQTVCINSPINPINYYYINGATGATVVGLPADFISSLDIDGLTISGTSTTQEGVFPYTVSTSGGCGIDSLSGTITVGQQVSTTFFCDPSQATSLNSVYIYWNDVSGCTSYEFTYSINDGPLISDSTTIPYLEILNVLPGQSVSFTLTNAVGVSCFQSASTSCTNLANESFEFGAFQSFPNPVNDILNMKSLQPIKNIQIFNLVGQQVFTSDYNEKEFQINLSHLSSGTYLVKAMVTDTVRTFKIVKN